MGSGVNGDGMVCEGLGPEAVLGCRAPAVVGRESDGRQAEGRAEERNRISKICGVVRCLTSRPPRVTSRAFGGRVAAPACRGNLTKTPNRPGAVAQLGER